VPIYGHRGTTRTTHTQITMGFYETLLEEEEEDDDLIFMAQGLALAAHIEESSSSTRRRRPNALPREVHPREREQGHARIFADYFSSRPVYSNEMFRRR
jgi:hypothetical protein